MMFHILIMVFSQAANYYQKKLIDFTQPVLAVSVLPIFFNSKIELKYHYKNTKFINNQSGIKNKINYIYRLICDTWQLFFILARQPEKNIVFYNFDVQFFFSVVLAKFLLRKKVFILVADYPFYQKKLSDKIYNWVLKKINGTIVFNSNIKCNRNSKLLPGLLYKEQIKINSSGRLNKNIILSGSLGKTTGLELALEYFSKRPEFTLYISGRRFMYSEDEFENLIEKYAEFKNIKFLGMLDYDEYLDLMDKCDVALSLREQNDEEHNYNFPSKILEYLSKSKMVVSTLHYKDIDDDLLFYAEPSIDNALEKIYKLSENDVIEKRRRVAEYLIKNFTEDAIVKIIDELIV